MFRKTASLLLLLSLVLVSTGCASILSGGPSWLGVETKPENIKIRLVGLQNGETINNTTPCRIELNRNSDYKLTIETPNYQSEEVIIRRHIQGWFFGNILLGGIVGMVIDAASSNMWDHNQHLIDLDLTSLETAPEKISLYLPIELITEGDLGTQLVYVPITFNRKPAEEAAI